MINFVYKKLMNTLPIGRVAPARRAAVRVTEPCRGVLRRESVTTTALSRVERCRPPRPTPTRARAPCAGTPERRVCAREERERERE